MARNDHNARSHPHRSQWGCQKGQDRPPEAIPVGSRISLRSVSYFPPPAAPPVGLVPEFVIDESPAPPLPGLAVAVPDTAVLERKRVLGGVEDCVVVDVPTPV